MISWGIRWETQVLRSVAEVLMRTARSTDIVGRLGGDEFAVFLPETRDPARWCRDHVQQDLRRIITSRKEKWLANRVQYRSCVICRHAHKR